MVIGNIITKTQADRRIKDGSPVYGVIASWDAVIFMDMRNASLRNAFRRRFPKKTEGVYYMSEISNAEGDVDLMPGKYLVLDAELKEYKTVRTFYRNYGHSEQEYDKMMFGDFDEDEEQNQ